MRRALVALALLAFSAPLMAAAQAPPVPFLPDQSVVRVCTSATTPLVFCEKLDNGTTVVTGGYEIELFNVVAAELGWTPDMIEWNCLDWDVMLGHLKANDGVCNLAVAGVDVLYGDYAEGLVYSWTTLRNGLAVMTTVSDPAAYSMWSFFDAFEWQVWVVTLATMIVIPFIIYAIEWLAFCWRGPGWPEGVDDESKALSTYFWEAVHRPFWTRGQLAVSWAGNIVVTVYSFLILIILTLYIGYATSNLTTSLLDSQITGIDSLPGKSVGTWTSYVEKMQKRGVAAAGYPWNTKEDEQAMVAALKSGTIKALVLDATYLAYLSASDCDLVVVGPTFDSYEQAVAFPKDFNNTALMTAYNAALTNLTKSGAIETIAASTLTPADAAVCDSGEASSAITFYQVAGLWILLAGSVGVGLLIVLLHVLQVKYARPVVKSGMASAKSLMNSKRKLGGASGVKQVVA